MTGAEHSYRMATQLVLFGARVPMSQPRDYLGMTREQIASLLGKPDDTGGTSRKYRTPAIYKYGSLEYHFEPWKAGKLIMVFDADRHQRIA